MRTKIKIQVKKHRTYDHYKTSLKFGRYDHSNVIDKRPLVNNMIRGAHLTLIYKRGEDKKVIQFRIDQFRID